MANEGVTIQEIRTEMKILLREEIGPLAQKIDSLEKGTDSFSEEVISLKKHTSSLTREVISLKEYMQQGFDMLDKKIDYAHEDMENRFFALERRIDDLADNKASRFELKNWRDLF